MLQMSERTRPPDRADMRHLPLPGGLDFMKATFSTLAFAPHFHDTFVLELVDQGEDESLCGREIFRAAPGELVVINPGEIHTGHPAGNRPLRYRSIYPRRELLQGVAKGLGWPGEAAVRVAGPVLRNPPLAAQFGRLFRALESSDDVMTVETLLVEVLSGLLIRHGQRGRAPRPVGSETATVRRVREYLRAHSASNLTLSCLADVARLSPFHLLRVFHKEVGLPPHQYQLLVRVERAKTLLRKGKLIAEAAYEVGFADQSHMTRCFKRFLGVTPGRYGKEQ